MHLYPTLMWAAVQGQLVHRGSLLFEITGRAWITGLEIVAIVALVDRAGDLLGFGRYEIVYLFGVSSVALGIAELLTDGVAEMPRLVRTGDLDAVLLRPVPALVSVLAGSPSAVDAPPTSLAPAPAPAVQAVDPSDPSALRLRIGDQVYNGLDLTTLAKWIEEGRVLEDHQVARGTSENWMDAVKVPALRPVFDRLRRARMGGDMMQPPSSAIGDTGAKKGLFGGMFGKKD